MPKISPFIPDDYLLKNLDTIAANIQIIPSQASMLLGISVSQLKTNREEGRPPAFVMQGGSIRYRVGDIRDYLNSQQVYKNSAQAYYEKMRRKNTIKQN